MDRAVDEQFVQEKITELKRMGFPPSEGYFLIMLTERETDELRTSIESKGIRLFNDEIRHPPAMLLETMKVLGLRWMFTLGCAVIASPEPDRHHEPPRGRHLRLVR